jgi:hypothetical protein
MRKQRIDINKRFGYLRQLTKLVANGSIPSAIITGEGGVGKTWTVQDTLKKLSLSDLSLFDDFGEGETIEGNFKGTFRFIKGYSTAKALYKTLYTNNGAVIVFDDCDNILKDATGVNILKGALDSYDRRIVSWRNTMTSKDKGLPPVFEFKGQVIFISNLPIEKIPQPLRSRSLCVDVSMTNTEKYDRMKELISQKDFMPEIGMLAKKDALEEIMSNKRLSNDVTLRTLCTAIKLRTIGGDWKGLLEYCTTTST